MRKFIYPYNSGSKSAKLLAREMGIKCIKRKNSKYRYKFGDVIINWGNAVLPDKVARAKIINNPQAVNDGRCKLRFFRKAEAAGVSIPPWTTDQAVAQKWSDSGADVMARRTTTGHAGAGIEVVLGGKAVPKGMPLYTKYIPKKHEYRVHVINGKVVNFQKKVKKKDVDNVDWHIRSHLRGFVFIREGVVLPAAVVEEAVKATKAMGLDFAGVDVIYSKNKAYVLEVNTAPGIEGRTLKSYANNIL